jgi:hypothetical protein
MVTDVGVNNVTWPPLAQMPLTGDEIDVVGGWYCVGAVSYHTMRTASVDWNSDPLA